MDFSESKRDVVTPVALVMKDLLNRYRVEMPDTSYVYEQSLDFEKALKKLIKNSQSNQDNTLNPVEALTSYGRVLMFNRTQLITSEVGQADRATATRSRVRIRENGEITSGATYNQAQGQFLLNFQYVSSQMSDLEAFEVAHITKTGLTGIQKIEVSFPDIKAVIGQDALQYIVDYEQLESLEVVVEGRKYFALAGSAKITGRYYSFQASTSIIEHINAEISTFYDESLASIQM